MLSKRALLAGMAATGFCLTATRPTLAQAYPTRPVKMVVPLPYPGMGPYQIAVDKNHNLWMNVWTSDVVLKYEPATGKWTTFDLPSRGTEVRHISIDERDGKLKVVIPEYRVSKMAVMNFRSEADIAALKAQTAR